MSSQLADKKCKPCQGDEEPLKGDTLKNMKEQLESGWEVVDGHHLKKAYTFNNFQEALDFTNRVGTVAEEQGHHPDIYLTWGEVELNIWTHKINGLTESDFIFAAKADDIV
ncbi:MAG: 4a-hydroxytetrahydrobiopterin dehydratase [Spartobacteria bacterium]|nr:4a-hydroxytetrahydrobiopterin dehydratase [Spartobacteria bacterium]